MSQANLFESIIKLNKVVPLELLADGQLEPIGEVPAWFHTLKPWHLDSFPLVESCLEEFIPVWQGEEAGRTYGPWEQETDEETLFLDAQPMFFENRQVLLLRNLDQDYREQEMVLQKARNNLLAHDALQKEIQKKEFLLHTIVHDLAGPLTSIKGAIYILNRPNLPEEMIANLLSIGTRAVDKQEMMIREILEVFSAELETLNDRKVTTNVSVLPVAQKVVDFLGPAFAAKGVKLGLTGPDFSVRGEANKLERVISNLVENGLRVLEPDRCLTVRLSQDSDWGNVEIFDDGPGVPPETAEHLFKKMAKGKSGGGKIGLGLYFCRLTVEAWGGQIGYRASETGGACFHFSLPLEV